MPDNPSEIRLEAMFRFVGRQRLWTKLAELQK